MNRNLLDRGHRITTAIAYAFPDSTRGSQVRDDIQWMPPGEQTVTPTVGGKPRELTILVDAALAEKFAGQFRALMVAAEAGTGDYPHFDYNHEFGAASGHPTEFYWGGTDPLTGGIRAKVTWTAAARAALEDRQYRRFSPHWLVDADTGAPVALSPNLGGLVNLAAFETIQSVRAAKPGPAPKNQMTTEDIQAAVKAALEPVVTRLTTLEAAAKAATPATSATAAAATVPAETQARIAALETAAAEAKQTNARQQVKAAQAAGQLAPQDKDAETFWISAIASQGAPAETVLRNLPKLSAPARMVTAGASGGAAGAVSAQAGAAADTAEGFAETFKVEAAKAGATRAVALKSAIAANKAGYAAWRAALGQPGL